MPTRILREGIITSEPVNRLSFEAEILYRRLMSVVDDYGRYYAHPSIVRANCYPLQLDRVSESSVKQSLSECESNALLFVFGDGKYIQLLKFRQQARADSKFPEPTNDELLNKCISLDLLKCSDSESDTKSKTDTKSNGRASREELVTYCKSLGLPASDGEILYDKWESGGWRNGSRQIKDWKSTVRVWKGYGYLPSQKNPRRAPVKIFAP